MDIDSQLSAFRERIDLKLQSHLKALENEVVAISKISIHDDVFESLQEVSAGGKRIRPFLVEKMTSFYSQETIFSELEQICVAVELFHIFCLVHDDVIDKAELRHGAQTIHARLFDSRYKKRGSEGSHLSNSQAILVGDILFNSVYQLFYESINKHNRRSRLLQHFSLMVQEVCIGQIIDVDLMHDENPDPTKLLEKNRLKTAYYSMARPLQLGALLANKENDFHTLERIGLELGMMYQLQDDLLDISIAAATAGKNQYTDIVQGQPTFISTYIAASYPKIFKQLQLFRGKRLTSTDSEILTSLFNETDVVHHIEAKMEQHLQAAISDINTLQNASAQTFLLNMSDYLSNRKK